MKQILISKKYYNFPETWNELTGDQLVQVLQVLEKDWPAEKKLLRLVQRLAGLSSRRFLFADVDEIAEYFYLLQFLLEGNTLTKNLLPEYKGFYGPADSLSNLLVKEYIYAESYYLAYKEQGSLLDLDNLVAVIYRPGKEHYDYQLNPDGDQRIAFNENLIGHYGSQLHHWSLEVKQAIVHWFEGCRLKMIEDYSDVFSGDGGEPAKRGMLSIVVGMAETATFGTFQQVEQLNLHTFMIGLSEAVEKSRLMEQQLKKTA